MIFENKREIKLRKTEVGDIIISNGQLYMITYDYSNECYGYVNLNTGHQMSKLDSVTSVINQFGIIDTRCFSNDSFTLTLK